MTSQSTPNALELPSFNGKTVVVTGGSDGIGKGIAKGFAQVGANVVIAARRIEKLEEAAKEIRETGARVLAVSTDATDDSAVRELADKTLAEFGRVDVLVNNAGGSFGPTFKGGKLLEMSESDFDNCFDVNVKSAFLCARAFVPKMMEQGKGVVLNVGSVNAAGLRRPAPSLGVYGAAKAALHSLSWAMAVEWGPTIRSVTIAAGDIETPRVMAWRDPAEVEMTKSKLSMQRFGTPADIASLAVFLASDQASWITGSVIDINGGV